jgi:SAM-dependent methyltransferase
MAFQSCIQNSDTPFFAQNDVAPLFDEQRLHQERQKAAVQCPHCHFLAHSVETELMHRVHCCQDAFHHILIIGARTDILITSFSDHQLTLANAYGLPLSGKDRSSLSKATVLPFPLTTDRGEVPLSSAQFDLIIDCLTLHTANNIPWLFREYWRLLQKNGVYIAAFYGGETLRELRDSLLQTELSLYGGAALRVIPMIDLTTALRLLQSVGFHEIVADRDINTISYPSLKALFRDIKGMGEAYPFLTPPPPMTYHHFKKAEHYYRMHFPTAHEGCLQATVEVIFLNSRKK